MAFSDTANSLFELNPSGDGFLYLGGVGFNDIEGTDFVLTLTGLLVPEPSALVLVAVGILQLGFLGSLRRP